MTATNRPTDAELGRVLDAAAMTIHRLARLVVPEVAADARNVRDRIAAAADAIDAAPEAPARLTPEQWQQAVERGFRGMDADYLDGDAQIIAGDIDATLRSFTDAALRAAFPHLTPNPED